MGNSHWKRLAALLAMAAFALGAVFFAPVQLGGSTLYSATVGTSMEPRFHKGDLALLRRDSSYRVGDVVLYESPVLHRPVLHRIIVIQNDHYFFKGDNNDFVDPGYATSNDLRGKLWLHVPKAGRVLDWFGAPTHTALLAGIAAAFLLFGGGAGTVRRRHRRRHGSSGRRPSVNSLRNGSGRASKTVRGPRFVHRPRKSAANVIGGVALLLALAALIAGFGAPTKRVVSVRGFSHAGVFSYRARTVRTVSTYAGGVARTGQPLFLNDFDRVVLGFSYRFSSGPTHHMHGTIALEALVASDSGWRNTLLLQKPTRFDGDLAAVEASLDLRQLRARLNQVSLESGAIGGEYTVALQPIVRVTGTVGGAHVASTFSPVLPFTATSALLELEVMQPTAAPGATSSAPSLAATLHPTATGDIPGSAANQLSIARYHVRVGAVRRAGLALAAFAVLAFLSKPFKSRRDVWSHERRVAFRFGCVFVDVASFADSATSARRTTVVPEFEGLAVLARYSRRPILRETRGQSSAYAVEDEGRLYIYRPGAAPAVGRLTAASA
jgi:signal peptidase I